MNKYIVMMIFFPCVAMENDIRRGDFLGDKLKNAGVYEINGLVDRAMYGVDFKIMKKDNPEKAERIKAQAMKIIAKAILKKSDEILKTDDPLRKSNAAPDNSDFFELSLAPGDMQPIVDGIDLLNLDGSDPALWVTSFN